MERKHQRLNTYIHTYIRGHSQGMRASFRSERDAWNESTKNSEKRMSALQDRIKGLEIDIQNEKQVSKSASDRYDRLKAALLTFTDANGADVNVDERWRALISTQVGSESCVNQDVAQLVALMLKEKEEVLRKREQDIDA